MLSGLHLAARSGSEMVESFASNDAVWVQDEFTSASFVLIQVDPLSGLWVVRSRFAPGSEVQLHLHSGPVFAYTINGEWGYPEAGAWCKPGDFLVEKAGTAHSLAVNGSNAVDILFLIFGTVTYLDSNRNVVRIEDWRTALEEYVRACEALGRPAKVIGVPTDELDRFRKPHTSKLHEGPEPTQIQDLV